MPPTLGGFQVGASILQLPSTPQLGSGARPSEPLVVCLILVAA
jgi:hypothetical protein